ncbi:Nucleic acid-binding, OB-fold [Sesbania bispinosa]|nr:Nucleic acid-binding, OB-fold [Sesbania bispinosa]
MALVHGPFDAIKDIVRGREAIRLKVHVIRIWEICQSFNPSNVFSVDMVLVDSEPRTTIYPAESELIPRFGVASKTSEEIQQTNGVSDYLYDFIGLLTAVGEEKEFKKFGRTIRVLEVELTDDKGVVECSLFGHFIEVMKNFLESGVDDIGILVIQFAKVKSYLGRVSLYTVTIPLGYFGILRFQKLCPLRIGPNALKERCFPISRPDTLLVIVAMSYTSNVI